MPVYWTVVMVGPVEAGDDWVAQHGSMILGRPFAYVADSEEEAAKKALEYFSLDGINVQVLVAPFMPGRRIGRGDVNVCTT